MTAVRGYRVVCCETGHVTACRWTYREARQVAKDMGRGCAHVFHYNVLPNLITV